MERPNDEQAARQLTAQLEALRSALIAGEESGFVDDDDPFDKVRQYLRKLPAVIGG